MPIFILSRRVPDGEAGKWPLVTYVNDVSAAMSEAKQAAGDRNVPEGGDGVTHIHYRVQH